MNKRIYLSPPHIEGRELKLVKDAFESNWIAPLGPHVDAFELEMCKYTGAGYAAALSSGTAAIHLALVLAGVERGDEVICSSFTFIGSANPIMYQGAIPVFVDSESRSWNMDPCLFAEAVADRIRKGKCPKAAILVHLYGQSADIDPFKEICERHNIALIEDAAESLGAFYKGKHTGTIGKFGTFSFNGNKIITTSGGGMLVSNERPLIEKARHVSAQARDPALHYQHSSVGYNYRMSNVLAAIGRGQLETLDRKVERRRSVFEWYRQALGDLPGLAFMPEPAWGRANRWLTCVTVDPERFGATRDDIMAALAEDNIESRPLWKPMHMQPLFSGEAVYGGSVSEGLFAKGLCLPSGSSMGEDDLCRVASIMHCTFCGA